MSKCRNKWNISWHNINSTLLYKTFVCYFLQIYLYIFNIYIYIQYTHTYKYVLGYSTPSFPSWSNSLVDRLMFCTGARGVHRTPRVPTCGKTIAWYIDVFTYMHAPTTMLYITSTRHSTTRRNGISQGVVPQSMYIRATCIYFYTFICIHGQRDDGCGITITSNRVKDIHAYMYIVYMYV